MPAGTGNTTCSLAVLEEQEKILEQERAKKSSGRLTTQLGAVNVGGAAGSAAGLVAGLSARWAGVGGIVGAGCLGAAVSEEAIAGAGLELRAGWAYARPFPAPIIFGPTLIAGTYLRSAFKTSPKQVRTVIVVGSTGAGKSELIKQLGGRHVETGEPPETSDGLASSTKEVATYDIGVFGGARYHFVDTKGMLDSDGNDEDGINNIALHVNHLSSVVGVVYVVQGRMDSSELQICDFFFNSLFRDLDPSKLLVLRTKHNNWESYDAQRDKDHLRQQNGFPERILNAKFEAVDFSPARSSDELQEMKRRILEHVQSWTTYVELSDIGGVAARFYTAHRRLHELEEQVRKEERRWREEREERRKEERRWREERERMQRDHKREREELRNEIDRIQKDHKEEIKKLFRNWLFVALLVAIVGVSVGALVTLGPGKIIATLKTVMNSKTAAALLKGVWKLVESGLVAYSSYRILESFLSSGDSKHFI